MDILLINPTTFMYSLSPLAVDFVIFCATLLGTFTIFWSIVYLLFRQIPDHCAFAPLENIGRRIYSIGLVTFSGFGAYAISVMFKNYFEIGRPVLLNYQFFPLIELFDFGFPSSHAATFAALSTTLFLIHRRAGVYVGILTLVICTARIIAGVHTPLDILGGYLVGVLLGSVVGFFGSQLRIHPLSNKVAK